MFRHSEDFLQAGWDHARLALNPTCAIGAHVTKIMNEEEIVSMVVGPPQCHRWYVS